MGAQISVMIKEIALAISSVALLAGAAFADAPPSAPKEASIPFANMGSIRDWRVIDNQSLYIQDQHSRWYRATLFAPCSDLGFTEAIGIETRGTGRFDRFSTIIVRGERCTLASLVTSDAPPKKDKSKAEAAPKE